MALCFFLFVFVFFSIGVFFHGHWQLTSTLSRTFRHLFAALHVRWLLYIFNRNACIYPNATRWDLPPYRITVWLIDDMMLIFVCLLVDMILGLLFDMRNRWTRTHIVYHPCITSEPANQVCLSKNLVASFIYRMSYKKNFLSRKSCFSLRKRAIKLVMGWIARLKAPFIQAGFLILKKKKVVELMHCSNSLLMGSY